MTAIILPIHFHESSGEATASSQRMQVIVNIQAEVLDSEVARHMANAWLFENIGDLLGTTTSELVLGDRLFWRYEVILGLPNSAQPGSGALYRIGQIVLDAVTGEIQDADALAEELRVHAAAIARFPRRSFRRFNRFHRRTGSQRSAAGRGTTGRAAHA